MPSFDVVSKVSLQEVDNAVNQARKEIATRYDFQGTHTEISLAEDKTTLLLKANSEGRLQAAYDVLQNKLVKRGVSLRALRPGPVDSAASSVSRTSSRPCHGAVPSTTFRANSASPVTIEPARLPSPRAARPITSSMLE